MNGIRSIIESARPSNHTALELAESPTLLVGAYGFDSHWCPWISKSVGKVVESIDKHFLLANGKENEC